MNIDSNLGGINKTNYTESTKSEISKDFKQELIRSLYKKVRQEVPQDGIGISEFAPVSVNYKDSVTEDIYSFVVQSGYNKNNPEERVLKACYQLSDDAPIFYMNIQRGSKQEILEYLGNERNSGKIKGYLSTLRERALQGN